MVLIANGIWLSGEKSGSPVTFKYAKQHFWNNSDKQAFNLNQLYESVEAAELMVTITAYAGQHTSSHFLQPTLRSTQDKFTVAKIAFPRRSTNTPITLQGQHILPGARIFVDGARVDGSVECRSGTLPDCQDDEVILSMAALPHQSGMHLLQVQNPEGFFSNEYLFWVD